jgi:hypothetical protein
MSKRRWHLDVGSRIVILLTMVLFVAALFTKGLGHDLLLEAGVFLVSVKLIMMAHRNSVVAKELGGRLDRMDATLARMEGLLGSGRRTGPGTAPHDPGPLLAGGAGRQDEAG